jgi:hypothetical protein
MLAVLRKYCKPSLKFMIAEGLVLVFGKISVGGSGDKTADSAARGDG